MSDPNTFLKKVLSDQDVKNDDAEVNGLQAERKKVEEKINAFYSAAKKTIRYGGSYAKNTMIKSNYDLDVICYFHEGENLAGDSLQDIYNNIQKTFEDDYYVEPKRSALRLKSKDSKTDFFIDVVPGRFVDGDSGDAFLYQSGAEKSRLKTNLSVHIEHIRDSKLTDVIRLLKIWKHENGLNLKTFVLELLVVDVLKGKKDKDLSEKLKFFWIKMRDDISNISVQDPANSNNDLSGIFDISTKTVIKNFSEVALNNIENGEWEKIFNYEIANDEEVDESKSLSLMDISHCQSPTWPSFQSGCEVKIKCFPKNETSHEMAEIQSDGRKINENWTLEYRASVQNMPYGSQIFWQVVNTGTHARDEGGLRGDFFKGKDLKGIEMNDQKINLEMTKYKGKHWIECFVVENNRLIARSGRFYINILPKVKIPYWRRKHRK